MPLESIKRCIIKLVNYDKVREITQGPNDNSALFQSHLVEGPQKFTNVDPDTPEGRLVLGTHFISEAGPDTHRKLQKMALGSQTPNTGNFTPSWANPPTKVPIYKKGNKLNSAEKLATPS